MDAHRKFLEQCSTYAARKAELRKMFDKILDLNAEYAKLEGSYQDRLQIAVKNPYMSGLLTHEKFMENLADDLGHMRMHILVLASEYNVCMDTTYEQLESAVQVYEAFLESNSENPRSGLSIEELLNPLSVEQC